jgi:hypothetical protein
MPKERHHLLIADRCFDAMKASGTMPPWVEPHRSAFRLGSIFPDTLFYDLPFFFLSRTGDSLHGYEGQEALAAFAAWTKDRGVALPEEGRSWLLGMANHFLADALYHPAINRMARPQRGFCPAKLSARDCHHWVESEMEAFGLLRSGPEDGYVPFLRDAARGVAAERACGFFREFLEWSGVAQRVPSVRRIRTCLFWQTLLLRTFAHPACTRGKPMLMRRRVTGYPGALIVPLRPVLPGLISGTADPEPDFRFIFADESLDSAVNLLCGRLLGLAARF